VPSNIVAGMFGIHREEYFETETAAEREPVQVDFGQREATIPPPSGYAGGAGSVPPAGAAAAAGPAPEAAAPSPEQAPPVPPQQGEPPAQP
jgi:LemA protein